MYQSQVDDRWLIEVYGQAVGMVVRDEAAFVFHAADPWDQRELPLLYAAAFLALTGNDWVEVYQKMADAARIRRRSVRGPCATPPGHQLRPRLLMADDDLAKVTWVKGASYSLDDAPDTVASSTRPSPPSS